VKGPIASTVDFVKTLFGQEPRRKGLVVNEWIDGYNHLQRPEDATGRNQHYDKMVDCFYELVTPFYEWGWGSSFHFAYRLKGECFAESMRRHEYYLASWLGLPPRSKVLDLGCGIGGPTRNIGRVTGDHNTQFEHRVLRQGGLPFKAAVLLRVLTWMITYEIKMML
jgi:sterol 24-C-methyltransferase